MMTAPVPSVMVTGASGLLGRAIMKVLEEMNWKTVGLAYSRVGSRLVRCDITDKNAIQSLVEQEKPEFIIHAAAERAPDAVEQRYEETKLLNVTSSGHLASIAKNCSSRLIYISTDYVFDGTKPPYTITDVPNPLNKYGQTKWDGEKAVLEADPSACVLRIPILYGPVEKLEESAVTCLLKLVKSSESKSLSHYEKRYPSHVRDIALILRDLIQLMMKDKSINGIFQWSGLQQMTKYDMALAMSKVFSFPHNVTPDPNAVPGAPRPYDSELDRSRLQDLGISHHTDFEVGIKESLTNWV